MEVGRKIGEILLNSGEKAQFPYFLGGVGEVKGKLCDSAFGHSDKSVKQWILN
jgi:hypothetical protein